MPTFKTFKDKRDGRIYNCVLMPDGKWWSAENLAWDGGEKRAPGNVEANVATHGWLYLDTLASGYCPEGTHLPSTYNWGIAGLTYAGLVSKTVSGGLDTYGMNILMAGYSGSEFGTSAEFATSDNGWVYFNLSAQSVSAGPGTGDYTSVRFIVDTFPVEFPHKQITSVSNLQFQTANRQFKSESGSYHTLGSQGRPVLKGTLTYDLATSEEEALFDGWFSAEDPWDNDDFPGIGSVTIQAVSIPNKTHTEKGISISLDVVIFPNPNIGASPWSTGPVPVMTPYAGVEAGFGSSMEQSLVTTSGRSTARKPTGDRGETFTISWTTTLYSALVFLEWYVHIANGRKQFLGSLCGKTAWLWKIVGSPNMAISVDMVKISMVINGRNVNRALPVTIAKG